MEKDNFLNFLDKNAGKSGADISAELYKVVASNSPASATNSARSGNNSLSGGLRQDGLSSVSTVAQDEFEQGIFMKIMLKSLPEVPVPADFTESVMRRVASQTTSARAGWVNKIIIGAALTIIASGGVILSIHTARNSPSAQERKAGEINNIISLPEIIAPIAKDQPKYNTEAPIKILNSANQKNARVKTRIAPIIPEKGDPSLPETHGATPED